MSFIPHDHDILESIQGRVVACYLNFDQVSLGQKTRIQLPTTNISILELSEPQI